MADFFHLPSDRVLEMEERALEAGVDHIMVKMDDGPAFPMKLGAVCMRCGEHMLGIKQRMSHGPYQCQKRPPLVTITDDKGNEIREEELYKMMAVPRPTDGGWSMFIIPAVLAVVIVAAGYLWKAISGTP